MPDNEIIILAGGLGTRLQQTVTDLPKCMAPVAGKPFLDYLIKFCQNQGYHNFVFSLGYKADVVRYFLETQYPLLPKKLVIESTPLGTGGALQLAAEACKSETIIALNGDTFFNINLTGLLQYHLGKQAKCTLALKPMENFDRYGVVAVQDQGKITGFQEKQPAASGLINGGIYAINRNDFLSSALPEKFSFEKDYLEKFVKQKPFYGFSQNGYFIDIGIPASYAQANVDFASGLPFKNTLNE